MIRRHKLKSHETNYNYIFFDSVRDLNSFVNNETLRLNTSNSQTWQHIQHQTRDNIQSGNDWYGTPPVNGIEELEKHTSFLGIHLLKVIQPKIKKYLERYLTFVDQELMPKPKVAYNALGLGVFSFDRAAMGLHKIQNPDLRTPLHTTVSQLRIELGKNKMKTTVKEVFAYFKDRNVSYPSLRLYLQAGANAHVKGDQLLYAGLACSELVEFLEERGIAVEVSVLLGTSFSRQVSMAVIRVKRFQDRCDKNQLLLMSSDPRYFRYRGFKALIALANHFDLNIPTSLGSITPDMGKHFVESLQDKAFVFEQSYSLEAATKEVGRIIETYQKHRHAKAA